MRQQPRGRPGLVERWNGKAWKVQPIPEPSSSLYGVAASSSSNAWAVDYFENESDSTDQTLAIHCC